MHLESQSEGYIFNYKKKNHMHRGNFVKSTHESGPKTSILWGTDNEFGANSLSVPHKIEVPY
jgi:hypothetical protein